MLVYPLVVVVVVVVVPLLFGVSEFSVCLCLFGLSWIRLCRSRVG